MQDETKEKQTKQGVLLITEAVTINGEITDAERFTLLHV